MNRGHISSVPLTLPPWFGDQSPLWPVFPSDVCTPECSAPVPAEAPSNPRRSSCQLHSSNGKKKQPLFFFFFTHLNPHVVENNQNILNVPGPGCYPRHIYIKKKAFYLNLHFQLRHFFLHFSVSLLQSFDLRSKVHRLTKRKQMLENRREEQRATDAHAGIDSAHSVGQLTTQGRLTLLSL